VEPLVQGLDRDVPPAGETADIRLLRHGVEAPGLQGHELAADAGAEGLRNVGVEAEVDDVDYRC
jgi:hypothetical protein